MNLNFLVPILVFFAGGYFLVKLRFFFVLRPISTFKLTARIFKNKEERRSLFLALAGTLGIGNIFGVATAIIVGGAGSVLWLLFSAVFAAAIKYAEVSVAKREGGLISAIRKAFGVFGKPLADIYALLAIVLALVMGTALQCGSFSGYCSEAYGTPRIASALFYLVLLAFVIRDGGGLIKGFTEKLIPLTTIIYIIMSISAVFINISRIPSLVVWIVTDAFSPDAAVGGALGYLVLRRINWGYCTGILSNEAGAGTSSLAHISDGNIPKSALGGIVEVTFDTLILCTLTALAVLSSVDDLGAYSDGCELVLSAFYSALGDGGVFALMICVLLFAILTSACWYFYGIRCAQLMSRRIKAPFTLLFVISAIIGAFIPLTYLNVISHTVLLFMSLITIFLLLKSSEAVTLPSELGKININGFLKVFSRPFSRHARRARQPRIRTEVRSRRQARRSSQ